MTDVESTTAQATKGALKEDFDEVVEKRAHLEYITQRLKRSWMRINSNIQKIWKELFNRLSTHLNKNEKEKAKEAVNKGRKLLTKRQKLIKIASREEDRWEFIKWYKSDVLASDTDD